MNNRKQIRLSDFDYSTNGAYFITICTKDKKQLFGKCTPNVEATYGRQIMQLSYYGNIVNDEIQKINNLYGKTVKIDKYVVMPNHIHMIIELNNGAYSIDGLQYHVLFNNLKGLFPNKLANQFGKNRFMTT